MEPGLYMPSATEIRGIWNQQEWGRKQGADKQGWEEYNIQ